MTRRGVVVGLDGAAWHLLDPFLKQGLLPRLAHLVERGVRSTMHSTTPICGATGWASVATGVGPGRHGVFGPFGGDVQQGSIQPARLAELKPPSVWELANAQGRRVGVFNVPYTYPPAPVNGWMVCGATPLAETPPHGMTSWSRSSSRDLVRKISGWAPGYDLGTTTDGEGSSRPSVPERILRSLRDRRRVLEGLLDLDAPDIVFAVVEALDRLQHLYHRYIDRRDPMSRSAEAARVMPSLARCFEEVDRIVGVLTDFAGSDGSVVVCSDHGFTARETSVHTNVLLERWGFLALKSESTGGRASVGDRLGPVTNRMLLRKQALQAKNRLLETVDWGKTRAYASPLSPQGICVNLAGREPYGIVEPDEADAVKRELKDRFRSLIAPDGDLCCDKVFLAEEIFHGSARERAPDVLPVLRDHRYELDDEILRGSPFTDRSDLPSGAHHPEGIAIFTGHGIVPGREVESCVLDVTPSLLYMTDLEIPDHVDGRVVTEAFDGSHLRQNAIKTSGVAASDSRF